MRIDGKPPGPGVGQDRRRLSHGRRPQRAPAHQLPASSRRHAEAAGLRLRARGRAGRTLASGRRKKFETAAAEAELVATMMRSPAEWAAHPAGPGGRAAARCSRSPGSARRRPARCRRAPSARSRASACSTSRASSPARCAGARSPRTAPTSCASRRRTCRACPSSTSTPAAASSPPPSTCAPPRARLAARRWLREAHVFVQGYRPGGLAGARLLARSAGRDASRHRRRLAVGLRPCGPVGQPARLRLAGAERQRHQRRRGRGGRRMPRPRSCRPRPSITPPAT